MPGANFLERRLGEVVRKNSSSRHLEVREEEGTFYGSLLKAVTEFFNTFFERLAPDLTAGG